MCTDGVQRTVNVDKSLNYPKGWLVEIRVTPEGESVSGIENKVVTGKVNADAKMCIRDSHRLLRLC